MNPDELHELPESERALALRLRRALRESEEVDAGTAGRLARARASAVDAQRGRTPAWLWASGGLTAAAAVAVVVLVLQLSPARAPQEHAVENPTAEAFEILTDEGDPEMYQDLELYRWLAQEGGRA